MDFNAQHGFFWANLSGTIICSGLFSWMAPTWVGDNLNKVGTIFGVYINLGLVAVQLFHITTGAAKFDPMGMIPALILAALFFWKTRASD
jgi:hypothetical protein